MDVADVLPEQVLALIAQQYRAGVEEAEDGFNDLCGDEDSLTGGLGQEIRHQVRGSAGRFAWSTSVKKLRGRGAGAPENRLGADGIIELQIEDCDGEVIYKKAVLFQAKKDWARKDKLLLAQIGKMEDAAPNGIVVNYTDAGYFAYSASAVRNAEGSPAMLQDARRSLADMLANDFLECRRGSPNVYYDAARERIVTFSVDGISERRFSINRRVRTTIVKS